MIALTILDRYIMRRMLLTLVFSIIALCTIFLVVNLLESLDEFLDQKATFIVIAKYYLYFFPEIIKLITPIAMLLSTLFTIGNMTVLNEITAMKSGGMSLYRLMIPLSILSIGLSFGQLYFNGWIVPKANERKIEIEDIYFNKAKVGGPIYNLYFRDAPLRNVVMNYYNANTKTGNQVSVEEFSSELTPRLTKRIEAEKIVWDSVKSKWILVDGISRTFSSAGAVSNKFDSLTADIKISHQQIVSLKKSVSEMNFNEWKDYIDLLEKGGRNVRQQRIDYYGQYAFPFANFIVVLFGVPFASIRKKGGIAIQIGAAMVISFLYLLFTKLGQTIGYASNFDPILSGWLANLVFFVAGLINLLRTRT